MLDVSSYRCTYFVHSDISRRQTRSCPLCNAQYLRGHLHCRPHLLMLKRPPIRCELLQCALRLHYQRGHGGHLGGARCRAQGGALLVRRGRGARRGETGGVAAGGARARAARGARQACKGLGLAAAAFGVPRAVRVLVSITDLSETASSSADGVYVRSE